MSLAVVFCRKPKNRIHTSFLRGSRWFSHSRLVLNHTPITIKWFYATDVPKSKPERCNYVQEKLPEVFLPFSDYDSKRLEKSFQKAKHDQTNCKTVDVHEDKLFQVDFDKFELSPIYWEGSVYEVRRGTWFTNDGVPIAYAMANEIEQKYQKLKPYNFIDSSAVSPSSSIANDLAVKFDNLIDSIDTDVIDVRNERDMIEIDGSYLLFFNEKDAAMFPKSINSKFQIKVIRELGIKSIPLISVQYIQRGYTSDLTETIFSNLPSNPLPAVSDILEKEIKGLFTTQDTESSSNDPEMDTKQMEQVMETDYDNDLSRSQSEREIDHLILCVHGIGQILGDQYESINFPHSINMLRNTMKKVYQRDEQYKKLIYSKDTEDAESNSNNRIQVLPITWRHKIDFSPRTQFAIKKENGQFKYPSLSEICVDGIRPIRNIVGDVLVDILLYYEPRYVEQIYAFVTEELNRVYQLYMERNPGFKGKVHILGHSLGSAISFDILSIQKNNKTNNDPNKDLCFDVENLFCVGSPVGMFKLLRQTNICSRSLLPGGLKSSESAVEAPKCKNLYNIFHSCDPVAYRMEPLINTSLARYKPEMIPFALKGFSTQIQELANFGDGITDKISKASTWFSKKPKKFDGKGTRIEDENAIGDIVSNLISNTKVEDPKKKAYKAEIEQDELEQLININRTGRVDYCLPSGMFDISVVSAVSAHVSYFEDEDTAGFIMREVSTSATPPVHEKKAILVK
jgi:hypothetical protein